MRHLLASCWPPWSACGSISGEAGWMTQATIRTLRPNVTQQEALRVFNLGGLRGLFWRLGHGPLQRLADVYVPYHLYRVRYEMRGAPKLECARLPLELHMPYWLGLYGSDKALRCRVLDAVRRRMEGAKANAFFEHWLAA